MLARTLTITVIAGLLAYASGALAHGPNLYNSSKATMNRYYGGNHYSYPYDRPYGGYGNSGWSLSFSLGSSYGGGVNNYPDRYYRDRSFRGNRSHYYFDHFGRHIAIPYHAAGPACRNYGYHRH